MKGAAVLKGIRHKIKRTIRYQTRRARSSFIHRLICMVSVALRDIRKFNPADIKGKRLLVVRRGGLGDLLFVTPILKELKERDKKLFIAVMTMDGYQELLSMMPYIDRLIGYPKMFSDLFEFFKYDYLALLDNSIEYEKEASSSNAFDYFAKRHFGVYLADRQKRPAIYFDHRECQTLIDQIPLLFQSEPIKVGIQILAGSPVRTPSPQFWARLIRHLLWLEPRAVVFLLVEQWQAGHAQAVIDLCKLNPVLRERIVNFGGYAGGLRRLVAMVKLMNVIIAPDSSVAHLAGGLDIPLIAIYGPFPARLRVKYYPNSESFTVPTACAPCFTHGHHPCPKASEKRQYFSPCFEELDAKEIALSVLTRAGKKASPFGYIDYLQMVPTARSETEKHRHRVLQVLEELSGRPLAELSGIELGGGGDGLIPEVVAVDLSFPYTKCGNTPISIKGDCRRLAWFANEAFDYLYSSHLFEDFAESENEAILTEWSRVIKGGGFLILLLPDQQRYLKYCEKVGEKPNDHHQIDEFGIEYLTSLAQRVPGIKIILTEELWEIPCNEDDYNLLIVFQKVQVEHQIV